MDDLIYVSWRLHFDLLRHKTSYFLSHNANEWEMKSEDILHYHISCVRK